MGGQVWWERTPAELRSRDMIINAVLKVLAELGRVPRGTQVCDGTGQDGSAADHRPDGDPSAAAGDRPVPGDRLFRAERYGRFPAGRGYSSSFRLRSRCRNHRPSCRPFRFRTSHELANKQVSLPQLGTLTSSCAIIGRLEGACNDPVNLQKRPSACCGRCRHGTTWYAAPSKRVDDVPGQLGTAPPPHQDPPRQDRPPRDQRSSAPGPHPGWAGAVYRRGISSPGQVHRHCSGSTCRNRVPPPPRSSAIRLHWVMAVVSLIMFSRVGTRCSSFLCRPA